MGKKLVIDEKDWEEVLHDLQNVGTDTDYDSMVTPLEEESDEPVDWFDTLTDEEQERLQKMEAWGE